jgi:hypothetical protein
MKRTIGALVGIVVLLPVPNSVRAQSMYRCVDASGNVAYGVGVAPAGGKCGHLAIPAPRLIEPPATAAASEDTFTEQSKACDAYYQSRAVSLSQEPKLEATCEENTRERYRRDSGQPQAPPSQ